MNLEQPDHSEKYQALQRVNESLAQLFEAENVTEPENLERLNKLTNQRDQLVKELLAVLDEPELTQFAQEEHKVNQKLSEVAQSLLSSAKSDIVGFLRSQKAVKRYK